MKQYYLRRKASFDCFQTETNAIGGAVKRKYWFAASEESPNLFWYKSRTDVTPIGKISLAGAAFTFDPREQGTFEIQ